MYIPLTPPLVRVHEFLPVLFVSDRVTRLFVDLDGDLIRGQVFAVFVITVAAAEAAVGLAILLSLYRNRVTVDMEQFNLLRW